MAATPITAIGISPANDSVRVVGLRNGSVFGTTTGVNPPPNLVFPVPSNATTSTTNRYVSDIVIDPINANTAYLSLAYYTSPSTAGQVWKTTNLNAAPPTWTAASGGLPNIPVNALVIDTCVSQPDHLWAGTDIGVYETTNGGTTWTPYGTGIRGSRLRHGAAAIEPDLASRHTSAACGDRPGLLRRRRDAPNTPTNTRPTPTNTATRTPTSTGNQDAAQHANEHPTNTPSL